MTRSGKRRGWTIALASWWRSRSFSSSTTVVAARWMLSGPALRAEINATPGESADRLGRGVVDVARPRDSEEPPHSRQRPERAVARDVPVRRPCATSCCRSCTRRSRDAASALVAPFPPSPEAPGGPRRRKEGRDAPADRGILRPAAARRGGARGPRRRPVHDPPARHRDDAFSDIWFDGFRFRGKDAARRFKLKPGHRAQIGPASVVFAGGPPEARGGAVLTEVEGQARGDVRLVGRADAPGRRRVAVVTAKADARRPDRRASSSSKARSTPDPQVLLREAPGQFALAVALDHGEGTGEVGSRRSRQSYARPRCARRERRGEGEVFRSFTLDGGSPTSAAAR